MGNHLKKRQQKLKQRILAFDRAKKGKGNASTKRPGSMNLRKQY